MPQLWTWEGQFSLEVPDDWTVRDLPKVIELEPADDAGALHITPLRRSTGSAEQAGDALRAVRHFAEQRDALGLECEPERRVEQLASARCTYYTDQEDEGRLWWDAMAVTWPGRAAICTFVSSERSSPRRVEALAIFDSLRSAP